MRSSTSAMTRRIVSSERLSREERRSIRSARKSAASSLLAPVRTRSAFAISALAAWLVCCTPGGRSCPSGASGGPRLAGGRRERWFGRLEDRLETIDGAVRWRVRNRSIALSIVTRRARPVSRSVAVTLRMPLRSRSSRTTIWLPASTRARPSIVNSPTRVLYRVSSFSPWKTQICATLLAHR